MADSTEEGESLIRLEEVYEGSSVGTSDFIFRKIGSSVPLQPSDSSFDFETAPSEALAVSERFGVLFLAHSEGFYVAKTKDVIELAKKIKKKGKGKGSIQGLSIVDVTIGRVSILALSTDSSTLAACVGGEIHLFSVASLMKEACNGVKTVGRKPNIVRTGRCLMSELMEVIPRIKRPPLGAVIGQLFSWLKTPVPISKAPQIAEVSIGQIPL